MEQETKAKEEEARVLEEELRAKAEVDEMRKREKIELEELATRLRESLEVIQTHLSLVHFHLQHLRWRRLRGAPWLRWRR